MKKIVLLLCIFILSSCVSVQRGADKAGNFYYSDKKPNLKITFSDDYDFYGEKDKEFRWDHKRDQFYIFVYYRKNKNIANTVDYYYPIDKVLNNNFGSKNLNIGHGQGYIGDYKYYYSDCIRAKGNGRNYLSRSMVFPSSSHDWLMVMFSYGFNYTDIKKQFSNGNEYLNRYPFIKDKFYNEIRNAIVSVEPFSREGVATTETAETTNLDGDVKERLTKLKELKDSGLITEGEYNQKRKALIDSI